MKKMIALLLALAMVLALVACGAKNEPAEAPAQPAETPAEAPVEEAPAEEAQPQGGFTYHIAGMKGPTSMGMVNLMAAADAGEAANEYNFELFGAADEIVPLLVKGELDMAAVPANLAATLYQKTQGGIQILGVNTLGVLYVVSTDDSITSLADLSGRTVLSTGKGTTPQYIMEYLLAANGVENVNIEYKSEAGEVLASMQADSGYPVAVLPQPYVTSALMQMEGLKVVLNLTEEWSKVSETPLVTGVMVARRECVENPGWADAFLAEYAPSIEKAVNDVEGTAALCEQYGVVAKAPIAQKALPACNIVYMDGEEMKATVAAYLEVLHAADPASVGGQLPDDGFYYVAQ